MTVNATVQSAPAICNPAPLGLFCFALTTAMLQMYHTRITGSDKGSILGTTNLVWGFGMFYGGFGQFCVGMWEAIRNNLFGFVAFSSYGAFWMGIALAYFFHEALGDKYPFDKEMAQAMYSIWGIFTFALWTLTLNLNYTLSLLFFELAALFFVLAAGVKNEDVDKVGGYLGLLTAATAFYLGYIEMLNDIVGKGKEIVPLFHVHKEAEGHGGFFVGGSTLTPGQVISQMTALQVWDEQYKSAKTGLMADTKFRNKWHRAKTHAMKMVNVDEDDSNKTSDPVESIA